MSVVYIGMDIHKDSFRLCAYEKIAQKVLAETTCSADPAYIEKIIDNLVETYAFDETTTIQAGYEAGIWGYSLYYALKGREIDCVILVPSTIAKSTKNVLNKNDRRDAKMIAESLANKSYSPVFVPDQADIEVKEYTRLRRDSKQACKKIKQQINALVLRLGYAYPSNKSKWTLAHLDWLKKLELPGLLREILDERLREYDHKVEELKRFDQRINELVQLPRHQKQIKELRCFKGIDTISAITIQIETADFNRFSCAKAYAAYVGLTTREDSSGPKNRHGSITLAGNRTIRTVLVEAAQSIARGRAGYKSKALKARQRDNRQEVN